MNARISYIINRPLKYFEVFSSVDGTTNTCVYMHLFVNIVLLILCQYASLARGTAYLMLNGSRPAAFKNDRFVQNDNSLDPLCD